MTTEEKPCRLTEKGRAKISATIKAAWAAGRIPRKSRAFLQGMWEKSNRVTRGQHGFGRQARGREDHGRALRWTVQAPDGEVWTFLNLSEWCRQHEEMFPSWPGAEMPTWKRAADGLRTAYRRQCGWHGWMVLTCEDADESG